MRKTQRDVPARYVRRGDGSEGLLRYDKWKYRKKKKNISLCNLRKIRIVHITVPWKRERANLRRRTAVDAAVIREKITEISR